MAQPLLVALLLVAAAAPPAQADSARPRELQASACSSVKIGGRGHVLYRRGVSCAYARRWSRRLAATRGGWRPRGWTCSSGSGFRGGGYCQRGARHLGWDRGD